MSDNNNDLNGKVGLDTTDFKAGTSEINRQIRLIQSGFQATAAALGDWSKTADGNTQRIESLNRVMDLQKQKIANLTNEYKKIVSEQGESPTAAEDLQIRINRETEQLNKNATEVSSCIEKLERFISEESATVSETDKLESSLKNSEKASGSFDEIDTLKGLSICL